MVAVLLTMVAVPMVVLPFAKVIEPDSGLVADPVGTAVAVSTVGVP
jgi:hypothetical protein